MNILIVSRGYPTEKYSLNGIFEFDQAKALAKLGHSVYFVAIDLRSIRRWRKWGLQFKIDEGVFVYSFNIPIGAISSSVRKVIGEQVLRRFIKIVNVKFDVIHAHFIDQARMALSICKEKGIPFVITEHSSAWVENILSNKDIKVNAEIFSKADCVIAVSESLKDIIKGKTGIEPIVVPNIADMPMVISKRSTSKPFTFISAGNLIRRKGFDILIEAFAHVVKCYPDVKLVILGDGPEYGMLVEKVKAYELTEKVSFVGHYDRNDFAQWLQESDAFVLASRGETFGVVCIEAMTYGVPVVATICGGPENYITKDVGILVRVESPLELFEAMKLLIEKSDTFSKSKIVKYAKDNFSAQSVSSKLVAIYKQIMKGDCLDK